MKVGSKTNSRTADSITMSWCLDGGNCQNREFSRIIRIARMLAKVKKNCQNQDLQDKRTRPIQPPQPQRGDICVENRSHHSLEPQRGDICYRLNCCFKFGGCIRLSRGVRLLVDAPIFPLLCPLQAVYPKRPHVPEVLHGV